MNADEDWFMANWSGSEGRVLLESQWPVGDSRQPSSPQLPTDLLITELSGLFVFANLAMHLEPRLVPGKRRVR